MKIITLAQKSLFINFFNRGGYVLDFSTDSFDNFTLESIGIPLCEKYKLSKGASLKKYCSDEEEMKIIKLFIDLFDYYELKNLAKQDIKTFPEYYELYLKLKPLYEKLKPLIKSTTSSILLESAKNYFNSDYITLEINSMIELERSNPTNAIGKAKELIESCCITILEKIKVDRDKNWDLNKLVSETTNKLNLAPKEIKDTIPMSNTIKQILQSLRNIAGGMAELRNPYGSGHGKSASFKGLEDRHSRLAIGASATLVNFLWDSYLLQYEK